MFAVNIKRKALRNLEKLDSTYSLHRTERKSL